MKYKFEKKTVDSLKNFLYKISFALVVTLVFALLRKIALKDAGNHLPYVTFYPAVIISSIIGGISSGITATITSSIFILLCWSLFSDLPMVQTHVDWIGFIIFVINCYIISHLSQRMKRSKEKAVKAQLDLQESKRLLSQVIDSIDPFVGIINKEMEWIVINKQVEIFFGKDKSEILGKKIKDLLGESTYNQAEPFLMAALAGEVQNFENQFTNKEGKTFYRRITYKPFYEKGEISGILAVSMDITSLKEIEIALKKSEEMYRKIFENSLVGIYRHTPEEKFIHANKAYAKMLAYDSPEELINSIDNVKEQLYADRRERERMYEILNKEGKVESFEIRLRKKDSSAVYVLISPMLVKSDSGEILYHEGAVIDLTARKIAEKKLIESEYNLKRANEELEVLNNEYITVNEELQASNEEIYSLNEVLSCQNDDLQELNATKDKFFSIIAHDLRNPFAALTSSAELLQKYIDRNDLEKAKNKAKMIFDSSTKGHDLLQNLLEWARSQLRSNKFNFVALNLLNTLNEVIKLVENSANNKSISIEIQVDEDLMVEADEQLIQFVFRNLISNAIKFTPNGGKITIKSEKNTSDVEISVSDNGIGIDQETKEKLFRIDTQISTQGTNHEMGTGLGLILCKEFIAKHGSKIWVESEVGKGSTFKFTLPLCS